jgi:hypothetical protein
MKYIKLFEDFKVSEEQNNVLLKLFSSYKEMIMQPEIDGGSINIVRYFESISELDNLVKNYKNLSEEAISRKFDMQTTDEFQRLLSNMFSKIQDIRNYTPIKRNKLDSIFEEMHRIFSEIRNHLLRVIDYNQMFMRADIQSLPQLMSAKLDSVQIITQYTNRFFEVPWNDLRKNYISEFENPFENLIELINDIILFLPQVKTITDISNKIIPLFRNIIDSAIKIKNAIGNQNIDQNIKGEFESIGKNDAEISNAIEQINTIITSQQSKPEPEEKEQILPPPSSEPVNSTAPTATTTEEPKYEDDVVYSPV